MIAKETSKKRKVAPSTTTLARKKVRKDTQNTVKHRKVPRTVNNVIARLDDNPNDSTGNVVDKGGILEEFETSLDTGEDAEDDQTAALLQGFESSDEDDEEVNEYTATIPVNPVIPTSEGLQDSLSAANASHSQPGVIYVGRVPHGFYEHQMRSYFAQFGDITRLRLSRNRRTGASKHYAFIEFKSAEVARIVANTMNNYLMFGHLLKVKFVTPEQAHADLFKGAGKRFKKVPWNRIERFKLQATDRDGWSHRIDAEETRRLAKATRLRALGYEFNTPGLRRVEDLTRNANSIEPSTG